MLILRYFTPSGIASWRLAETVHRLSWCRSLSRERKNKRENDKLAFWGRPSSESGSRTVPGNTGRDTPVWPKSHLVSTPFVPPAWPQSTPGSQRRHCGNPQFASPPGLCRPCAEHACNFPGPEQISQNKEEPWYGRYLRPIVLFPHRWLNPSGSRRTWIGCTNVSLRRAHRD